MTHFAITYRLTQNEQPIILEVKEAKETTMTVIKDNIDFNTFTNEQLDVFTLAMELYLKTSNTAKTSLIHGFINGLKGK